MHRKLFGRNLGINDHCLFRFGCMCLCNCFMISLFSICVDWSIVRPQVTHKSLHTFANLTLGLSSIMLYTFVTLLRQISLHLNFDLWIAKIFLQWLKQASTPFTACLTYNRVMSTSGSDLIYLLGRNVWPNYSF